ncbi:hypothetical protein AUJ84_04315 [Candidatus Pacearchaeota archaeon CG1_02_32_132]|nr:MAG: hypothetical protein AUJ84_04315 [Candidatus Pacearchaeota archaeon CG1_02_32_132]
MKIIIVDDKDNVIDSKEREALDYSKDIYRVSALWVLNNKKEILLARRALSKKQNPGKWGPAVAGTIEEGETYESNIVKEAEEELGLKNINPKKGFKELVLGQYKHFTQWFILKKDIDLDKLKINKDEVAQVGWFNEKQLLEKIDTNSDDVLKDMKGWFEKFR